MLAQSFMAAEQLGLRPEHREALVKTLGYLERGEVEQLDFSDYRTFRVRVQGIKDRFNMAYWSTELSCGTVRCLGGTAEMLGKLRYCVLAEVAGDNPELSNLLYVSGVAQSVDLRTITITEAAQALRNYLTTGKARWYEILPV